MNALESRDWSMIRFWLACLCSVDWDVAGPFDSDAPMLFYFVEVIEGRDRIGLGGASQVLGKSMKFVC